MRESTSSWIMATGGAVMVISFALGWSSAGDQSGDNPFHYPFTGGLAWVVLLVAGVAAFARSQRIDPVVSLPPIAWVVATDIALVLMVLCVIAGGRTIDTATGPVTVDRGPGMWTGLAGAVIASTGAVLGWVAASRDRRAAPAR